MKKYYFLFPLLLFISLSAWANPSMIYDGPHIVWENDADVNVFYLTQDTILEKSEVINKTFSGFGNTLTFAAFGPDSSRTKYTLCENHSPEKFKFTNVPKIFAVGDIHGQYERLVGLLSYNKIVDENLNWNWGKGHLVFCGDIFDRGDKVTECLWLIYKLSLQAEKVGGKIHMIIGNHEEMVMTNDLRYLAPKYSRICDSLGYSYADLFAKNTEFGKWLRSKNVVIKIDEFLFTHAGISPILEMLDLSLEEINVLFRSYMNKEESFTNLEKFLAHSWGPIWYRGYFYERSRYPRITKMELEKILKFHQARSIIVGHTHVDQIDPLFGGLLFGVDIPMGEPGIEDQALLIQDNKFYRCFSDKRKKLIFSHK